MRLVFYSWLASIILLATGIAVYALSSGTTVKSLFVACAAIAAGAALVWLAYRARDWCWAVMISGTALYVAAHVAQEYILEFRQELYSVTPGDAEWDKRKRAEVIADLAGQGIVARPEIVFTQYEGKGGLLLDGQRVLHLGTFPNSTIVQCNETGNWSIFKSDRYGFRNPSTAWNSPAAVMLVGDSYISGACVSDENTLRNRLVPHVGKVVSVGAAGYGPISALATIREFTSHVQPRAVVWFFNAGNDVGDLGREVGNPILMRYLRQPEFRQSMLAATDKVKKALDSDYQNWLAERQRATNQNFLIVAYQHFVACNRQDATRECKTYRLRFEFLIWKLKLAVLRDFIARHGISLRMTIPDEEKFSISSADISVLGTIFDEAAKMLSKTGTRLLFVYHPPRQSTLSSVPDNIALPVLDAARSRGFTLLDLGGLLNEHPDPKLLYAGHFNNKGYQFAADKIGMALKPMMQLERQSPAGVN